MAYDKKMPMMGNPVAMTKNSVMGQKGKCKYAPKRHVMGKLKK